MEENNVDPIKIDHDKQQVNSPTMTSQRVVQPSESFKKEVTENPDLLNTVQPIPSGSKSQSAQTTSSVLETTSDTEPSRPIQKHRTKPKVLTATIILAAVLAVGGSIGAWTIKRDQPDDKSISMTPSVSPQKPSAPTEFEKKLSAYPDYLSRLNNFSLPVFIPSDQQPENTVIGSHTINGSVRDFVYYGINSKFGQGIVPGTYSVSMFTLSSDFNPPTDCGLPTGGKASSPITCSYFDGADKDTPAYTYQGQQPGGITNTNVPSSSYLTLYVKRNNQVITVQTSASSAEDLYAYVKSMKQIHPLDLPADTGVSFDQN